jgi:putative membrane protein
MMTKAKKSRESSIVKGALAGLIGGIAGAAAKAFTADVYSSHISASIPAASAPEAALQAKLQPWVAGAIAGAVYGAAVEIEPNAAAWRGAGFGLAMRKFTPETTGVQEAILSVRDQTRQRQAQWISYAVFGLATEAVRRLVRKGLQ